MRSSHLLCLFALAAAGCASAPDSDIDGERADEMVNGTTRPGQLPYVYLSQFPGFSGALQRCSGLAISRNWILTAEHCFRAARNDGYGVPVTGTSQPRAAIAVQLAGTSSAALGVVSQQIRFPAVDLMLLRVTDPLADPNLGDSVDGALNAAIVPSVRDTVECWTNGPSTLLPDGGLGVSEPRKGRFTIASASGASLVLAPNAAGQPTLVSGDSGSPCFKTDSSGVPRLAGVVSQVVSGGTSMTGVAGLVDTLKAAASLDSAAKSTDGDGDGLPDLFFRKEPMEDPNTATRPGGFRVIGEWRFPKSPALKGAELCSRAAASGRCEEALDAELQPSPTDPSLSGAPWQVIGLGEFGGDSTDDLLTGLGRTDLVLWDETSKTLAFGRRRIEGPAALVSSNGERSRVRLDAVPLRGWVTAGVSRCGASYGARPVAFGRLASRPAMVVRSNDDQNICVATTLGARVESYYGDFLRDTLRKGEQLKSFTDFDGDGKLDFAFESPVLDPATNAQLKSGGFAVWQLCFRTYDPQVSWKKLVDPNATKDTRCTQLVPGQRVLGSADIDLDGRAEMILQDPSSKGIGVIAPPLPRLPVLAVGHEPLVGDFHTLALSTSVGSLAGGVRPIFVGPRVMTNRGVVSGRILAYRVQRGDFNGETAMLTLDDSPGTSLVPHPYVLGTPPPGMVPVVP